MAGYQRSNLGAGVSVTFGTADTSLFPCMPYFWQSRAENALKARFGRETSGELSFRFIRVGGYVLVRGDWPGDKPIEPTSWEGQQTQIVIQHDTGKTITFEVVVEKLDLDSSQKDSDLPMFEAVCLITAKPTYSGFGSATAGGEVTKEDITLYDGQIVIDPAPVPLVKRAKVVIDWWTLEADTDEAVIQRLVDAMAAAIAPDTDFKQRPGAINQDAPDGGVTTLTWGLTDTNDDVLLPRNSVSDDSDNVANAANTAALNDTPPTPANSSHVVKRSTRTVYLHDGAALNEAEWGKRSPLEDITFPGSPTTIDKSTIPLAKSIAKTEITANATEPSWTPGGAYKTTQWSYQQYSHEGQYQHRHEAALTTPQESHENAGSSIYLNASGLADSETHLRVVATVSTADPSGAPSGKVLYSTVTREIHDNAFERAFIYKYQTPLQEIETRGSSATATVAVPESSLITMTGTCSASDTVTDIIATLYAAHSGEAGFEVASVNKIPQAPTKYQARVRYSQDHLMVVETSPTSTFERMRSLAGGAFAAVKIVNVQDITATVQKVWFGMFGAPVSYCTIIIRRRIVDDVAAMAEEALVGSTNNAPFRGRAAGTVKYQGKIIRYNIDSEADNLSRYADHVFRYRSIGWFDSGSVPEWTLTDAGPYARGDTPSCSDFDFAVDDSSTGDFSVFES